ncbi:ExbD/TolR family protein [Aeoliella mucimassa]|uniref:Biopolymer transport protein ExbD/TolR n=1 Tax=Aeoliella mucimassa TaxID=2527972 RepID=A0A518AUG9_9BACT|nr:biopolymer transporter ExbD [Aeoliella mucimassa]QDU58352.1 Biopolymer transport protein ExbD/TolR [Aeoliella mucimassa]
MRKRRRNPSEPGVMLSPLIDCVFLLLIFFLVTSMIKRFERQIPVTLSDDTSAITTDPMEDSSFVGVDRHGGIYRPTGKTSWGAATFALTTSPNDWLNQVIRTRGEQLPITVVVERGTPFQKVITVQDKLELIGFNNIRFRLRDYALSDTGSAQRLD